VLRYQQPIDDEGGQDPTCVHTDDCLEIFETPNGTEYLDVGSPENRKVPGGPDATGCQVYFRGHTLHWIPFKHSLDEPHRTGRLMRVNGNVITINYFPVIEHYRTHQPRRLVDAIEVGGAVAVCEKYGVLRGGGAAFSICNADELWTECDYSPIASTSFGALAERMHTHGGFSVPGEVIVDRSMGGSLSPDEDDLHSGAY